MTAFILASGGVRAAARKLDVASTTLEKIALGLGVRTSTLDRVVNALEAAR